MMPGSDICEPAHLLKKLKAIKVNYLNAVCNASNNTPGFL